MIEEQVKYIKSIQINKLWGNVDIDWQLDPKVNILVGKNGVGKTTLLNIIESVIIRQRIPNHLEPKFVKIKFDSNRNITLEKIDDPLSVIANDFEKMLIQEEDKEKKETEFDKIQARLLLSMLQNNDEIKEKLKGYSVEINNFSQSKKEVEEIKIKQFINLTKISTFEMLIEDFIDPISKNDYIKTELDFILIDLINDFKSYQLKIKKLIESKVIDLDDEIQRLLNTDNNSEVHSKIIQLFKDKEKITAEIEQNKNLFLDLINDLFAETDKTIDFDENNSIIFRKSNYDVITAYQLSSGEKQILIILLKILLQENKHYIVLMDEPELSLHLSWQHKLINMIQQLNPNCQLIIVTHAAGIFSKGWMDKVVKMDHIIKS